MPGSGEPAGGMEAIALAQLGGRICANDESLPEWKSGLRIYHRGGPDDVIRVRDAYIAAAAAAGWTKVNIEEKKDRGAFSVVLHRADDSKGIVLVVASSAGFVRVNAQRSGWEDQVRQRDLENSRKVEESLDRAQSAP